MKSKTELLEFLNEQDEVKRFKHLEELIRKNKELNDLYERLHYVSKELTNCKHLGLDEASNQYELEYKEILSKLEESVLFNEYLNSLDDVKNTIDIVCKTIESHLENNMKN